MKNKLSDLNNHLFAQLERLSDEDIVGDSLDTEIKRAKAVSNVAKSIIGAGSLAIQAVKLQAEYPTAKSLFPELTESGLKHD